MITIKYTKKSESYDGNGSGLDNYHAPAQWWVIATNGEVSRKVGFIWANRVRFMETPTYQFSFAMESAGCIVSIGSSGLPTTSRLRDMKAKVEDVDRWLGTWFRVVASQKTK